MYKSAACNGVFAESSSSQAANSTRFRLVGAILSIVGCSIWHNNVGGHYVGPLCSYHQLGSSVDTIFSIVLNIGQ